MQGRRSRGIVRAAKLAGLAAALAAGLALPAAAPAAPGDVYVADRDADTVWKLGPAGGEATPLAQGVPPFAGSPYGMTLGPDGFLYVADEAGRVLRVNRGSGAVQPVANLTTIKADTNPIDVAFDARGRLHVVDFRDDHIYRVNLANGALTPVFEGTGDGGFNAIAIRRNGTIFISDEDQNTVYRLSTGGTLTPIIENRPDMIGPDGIMLSPDERYLYIGSWDVPRFFRYDLRSGQITKFSLSVDPYSLALLPSNRLIFSDETNGDLDTVSRLGGGQAPFSTDPDLDDPRDIVVEPRRCGGRIPTVVGTNAPEVISGSPFADVISTLGGDDVVMGLGGDDVICGGAGRDRLLGGPGRDRLLGQAGPDLLIGGKGRDTCKGGPGRNQRRAC